MFELEELITKYNKLQPDNTLDVLWYLSTIKLFIDKLLRENQDNNSIKYLKFIIDSEFEGFGIDVEDTIMTCYDVLIQVKKELTESESR